MKHFFIFVLLSLLLAACVPATTPSASPTSTITATATPPPVETSHTPTATASAIPSPSPQMSPSPWPTIRVVMTPDAVQVERWKEYEEALAIALFPPKHNPQSPSGFLCEWEFLGRADQEVYVWAECMSIFSPGNDGFPYDATTPAVIHIGADGAVQSVEIPGLPYDAEIRRMFPPNVQERYFDRLINRKVDRSLALETRASRRTTFGCSQCNSNSMNFAVAKIRGLLFQHNKEP